MRTQPGQTIPFSSVTAGRVWRYLLTVHRGDNDAVIRAVTNLRKGRGLTLRPGIAKLARVYRYMDRQADNTADGSQSNGL